jgi:hypothetical protein
LLDDCVRVVVHRMCVCPVCVGDVSLRFLRLQALEFPSFGRKYVH